MDSDELYNEWHKQKFEVEVTIRYHRKRRQFFGRLHKISVFSSVCIGAVIAGLSFNSSSSAVPWLGLLITVISAADFILGFSKARSEHEKLQLAFSELGKSLSTEITDPKILEKIIKKRLSLQVTEPDDLVGLKQICYEAACNANNLEFNKSYRCPAWLKPFAQLGDFWWNINLAK